MPATGECLRLATSRRLRLVAASLALAFLGSTGVAETTPAEAANWSRQIAALRAGQVAYEAVMRSADRDVRSLKRARTQARRKLKQARRRLDRAVERRTTKRVRLRQTRAAVRVARSMLAAASMETPPPPDATSAMLSLRRALAAAKAESIEPTAAEPAPPRVQRAFDRTGGSLPPVGAPSPGAGAVLLPGAPAPGVVPPSTPAVYSVPTLRGDVTVADVVALERKLKRDRRALAKARRQANKAWRGVRARRRAVASTKARLRGAMARREGAEAALASRILAMSTLAQRRVVKQTRARAGVVSGFAWPGRGRISQRYGCTGFRLNPPRGSCRHFHDGLDIAGYLGSPIRAAAVGVVSYIGWNPWDERGRAFMIVVAHRNGYETLYGHVLPTRRVRVGQLVRRGEVIGYMGNTGRSTGVHLHFELRRGRTTLDPLGYL